MGKAYYSKRSWKVFLGKPEWPVLKQKPLRSLVEQSKPKLGARKGGADERTNHREPETPDGVCPT